VVEDRFWIDGSDQPVVEDDVADGEEERYPGLIKRDHGNHDEEMEMHLDQAAGKVHQDRRGRDQTECRCGRSKVPPVFGKHRHDATQRDERTLPNTVEESGAIRSRYEGDRHDVQPDEHEHHPVPADPEFVRQGCSVRQESQQVGNDPLMPRSGPARFQARCRDS
jgi:hypothetical protein